jgi:hypothetical protein
VPKNNSGFYLVQTSKNFQQLKRIKFGLTNNWLGLSSMQKLCNRHPPIARVMVSLPINNKKSVTLSKTTTLERSEKQLLDNVV